MRFLIQPDRVRHKNGEVQSFSEIWLRLAADYGCQASSANVDAPDFFHVAAQHDAFMWRFGYQAQRIWFAKIIISSVEKGLRKPVFPNSDTIWHFEDKVAQKYFLESLAAPVPDTQVFWNRADAEAYVERARFPLVTKLAHGFRSSSVRLLADKTEALAWITQVFGRGVTSIEAKRVLTGRSLSRTGLHHGYAYFQEFLDGNDFDTRVTVIGDRAFAFRRFNRRDDFRASGSGLIDWNPEAVDTRFLDIAYGIATASGAQSLAADGMFRDGTPVIGEISYTYASWAVRDCPGHWLHRGRGVWTWVEGHMEPARAIFDDLYGRAAP